MSHDQDASSKPALGYSNRLRAIDERPIAFALVDPADDPKDCSRSLLKFDIAGSQLSGITAFSRF